MSFLYKYDWKWKTLYLYICPTYAVYREQMYDNITVNSPDFTLLDNENTFMYAMSCNDQCVLDFENTFFVLLYI